MHRGGFCTRTRGSHTGAVGARVPAVCIRAYPVSECIQRAEAGDTAPHRRQTARMRTLGLDLSVVDSKTWLASIEWADGRGTLVALLDGLSNSEIIDEARKRSPAEVVGIDCPFGWPRDFVELVRAHSEGTVDHHIADADNWRSTRTKRVTDLLVQATPGLKVNPLSVSSDKIGATAMRCATLLAEMTSKGLRVDRSGREGIAVEVYPAASLNSWDLPFKGYKETKRRLAREALVNRLLDRAGWLSVGNEHREQLTRHDDALDAVVAALSARAARWDLATGPTDGAEAAAVSVEGWIWVPQPGSLEKLAV